MTATRKTGSRRPPARLRLVLDPDLTGGPGKVELLEGMRETGFIAAICRRSPGGCASPRVDTRERASI